jgi:hypothetical protein
MTWGGALTTTPVAACQGGKRMSELTVHERIQQREKKNEEPKRDRKQYTKILPFVSPQIKIIQKPWKRAEVFIQLGRIIPLDKLLSSSQVHLATVLCMFDMTSKDESKKNKHAGVITAGIENMAYSAGKSEVQISRDIKVLKEAGYIKRGKRGKNSYRTTMTFPVLSSIEEIPKRFRLFNGTLNAKDFEYMFPVDMHVDLNLFFKVVNEIRAEYMRNRKDKNSVKVTRKDLEKNLLERFHEEKNKPKAIESPAQDKKTETKSKFDKYKAPEIVAQNQMVANYLKSFWVNKACGGIDTASEEDQYKFNDASNRCIAFSKEYGSNFEWAGSSPLDIAKYLCESIEERVEELNKGWKDVTPGWFNSDKAFQRMVRYMNDQGMLRNDEDTGDGFDYNYDDEDDSHQNEQDV